MSVLTAFVSSGAAGVVLVVLAVVVGLCSCIVVTNGES